MSYVDPEGEYGWVGFVGGTGVNFAVQFFFNMYSSNWDVGRSLRCISLSDVFISGVVGAFGPTLLGNVLRGTPGWAGTTQGQNAYIWATRSFPIGVAWKAGIPDYRPFAGDCECNGLGLGGAVSKFVH